MTNTFIYVGDSLLDLDPGTLVTINIQSINVGDLKSRNVSYTNQFKVPITENNSRIFGYVQSEWSRSAKPYQFNECKIVQNGIETLPEAICIITKYEKGYFVLNIFEQLFDIFQFLEGKKIKDIDPIPDSGWLAPDIDLARDNTSGIIAAALQWGHGSIYESEYFLPCFFYHTFITEILTTTGLTLSGAILTDPDFTDLVIPFPGDTFDAPPTLTEQAPSYIGVGSVGTLIGSGTLNGFLPSSIEVNDLLLLLVVIEGTTLPSITGWTYLDGGTFKNDTPVTNGAAGLYYRTADGTETNPSFSVTGIQNGCQIYQFRGNGADLAIDTVSVKLDGDGASTITYPSVTVSGGKRTLVALLAMLDSNNPGTPTGYTRDALDTVDSGALMFALASHTLEDVDVGNSTTSTGGGLNGWATFHVSIYNDDAATVDWNLYWPDIEVKDILRDFFTRFAIIARQKNNIIYLKTIEEILADRSGALNWTAKLTKTDKPIDFKTNYAQENYFDYNNQENDPELGRGIMTIDNETLDPIDTIFSSVFDTVNTQTIGGFYNSAYMDVYDTESEDITDFKNSPPFTVLTLRDPGSDPDITFFATPRSDYKVAYFVDAGEAKDSGFQYFVDTYYNKYSFALQKSKIIVKEYLLTESDIYNYNSHKMIYDGEGYYLVNKIRNFVPDKITTVELFKVM